MSVALEAIDVAMREIAIALKLLGKGTQPQIRGSDQRASLKSTAYAWFRTHRALVKSAAATVDLTDVDRPYQVILDSTEKFAAKRTYLVALNDAKAALVKVRANILAAPASASSVVDDLAPDFSPLASNPEMRDVLVRRWLECIKCVRATAHLAAIVMMGGLLEALFVARANAMPNKSALLSAVAAPKDKTGKTINYQTWMLDSYIKVAHELGWITDSAKQLADVLKEYRNYVHPEKELRHQVELEHNDSALFWPVTKALVRQLLASV